MRPMSKRLRQVLLALTMLAVIFATFLDHAATFGVWLECALIVLVLHRQLVETGKRTERTALVSI
jgi:hypothetical protein